MQTTIRTYSGKAIDFLDPKPNQFKFVDIAYGLSTEYRFAGQTPRKYTVLQHLLACESLAADRQFAPAARATVLMHDAAEAFMRDIPRPLKNLLPGYKEIEDRLLRLICDKYSVDLQGYANAIEICDEAALAAEQSYLWDKFVKVRPRGVYQAVSASEQIRGFIRLAKSLGIDVSR